MNNENKEANEQSAKNSTSLDGQRLAKLEAINSELLDALQAIADGDNQPGRILQRWARAAIAKATEGGAL